jgi:hypothetical protein
VVKVKLNIQNDGKYSDIEYEFENSLRIFISDAVNDIENKREQGDRKHFGMVADNDELNNWCR